MSYNSLENAIDSATEEVLERDDKAIPTPLPPSENDYLLMAFNSLLQAYLMRSGGLSESKQPKLTSIFNTFATQG